MNRSTLLSVLLVGLLVAQGGAYGLSQNGSALSAEASAPDGGTSLSSVGVWSIDAGSSATDSNDSEPTTEDTESDSSDGESDSGDETESEDEADGEDSENDDASSSESSGESDGSNDGEDDNGDSDGAERDSDDTTTVDDSPSEGATTDEEPVTTEVNTEPDDGSESASDDETPADSSDHDPTSEEEASDGDTESPTTAGEDESDGDSDDTTAEVETETETQTKADADSNTEPGTETPQEPESTTGDEATHTDATDEDDPSSASADPKTDSDSDGDPEAESGSESDDDSEESGSASSEDEEDEAGDTASNSASSSGNDSSSHTESSGENTASDTGIATDSDFDDTESEGDTEDASDSDPESESEPNEDADNTEQAVESSSNDDSSSDGESRSADGTVSDEGENADDESTEALTPVSSGASLAETTAQGGSNPGGESEGNDDARSGDEKSNDEVDIETLRADDEGEDDDESDGEATEADNDEGDEDNESGADTEDGEDGDQNDGEAPGGGQAVSSNADFDVVDSELDAPIGSSGTLTIELENDGEDADNAVVNLQSQAGGLTFGGSANTSQFVGDWEEGETRTIEVDASVATGAAQRSYPVQATVSYQNDDNEQVQSPPVSFGVTPDDEQDFTLDDVDSSLSAGQEGTISGTITNEGPEDAEDAVLVFAGNGSDVLPRQSEVVLGDLDDDESVDFEYPVAVEQGAPPGERQVPFVVEYQNEAGNTVRSGQLNAQVEIDAAEDQFEVTDVDSDLEPGETGTVEVTIENQREDLTDATISLQSVSPAIVFGQAANTSKFVGEFEEGDTQTIELKATATQTATEGEYPVQASVSYTDEDNQPGQGGPIIFGVPVDDIDDDFEVTDVDSDLEPGETGTVEVTVENEEEDVTDARVTIQSLSPSIAFGQAATANASVFVGEFEEGDTETVEVRATVAQDATEGEYPMQALVSYVDEEGRRDSDGPFAFGVPVGGIVDDFKVVNVNSTVPVGGEGTIRVTLNNTEENATEATVSLESISSNFQLGEGVNATQFVGRWGVGERRTVEYEVSASNATEQRSYAFRTSVSYTDSGNQGARGGPFTIGVTPLSEQSFALSNTTANLRVGSEGNVSGAVTNEGPQVARNAVVQLTVNNPNIDVQQNEVALGTLQAGETANFSFSVDLSSNAEAGVQQFAYVIEYDNQDGEPRRSERLKTQVEIEPDRNAFIVGGGGSEEDDETDGTNQTDGNRSRLNVQGQEVAQTQQSGQNESEEPLTPGESRVVTVPITNNRDVTYRNIEVQAFTNDPLSLADDQAFISELRPGETATVSFEVSVSGDALPGTYPISMDFQYDTPDGDTQLSDTYEVPIEVEEQEGGLLSSITDGGIPWLLIVVALLVAGVLGYLLYRQRNEDDADDSSVSFESTSAIESGATTGSSESTRQIGSGETSDSSDSTED